MIADLKPYPAMKDSGVEWLGEVPEHWEVRRLRTILDMRVSNVDKHTKEGDTPVRLCNYVDVHKNDRIIEEMVFMRATATPDEIERFRLESGDVLITKDSETWDDIGVPALVTKPADDLICGYHLALLRPFGHLLSGGYLFRALQSKAVAYQFHVKANGVTRYGLSHSGIKSIWFPLPPLPEQTAIVRYLDYMDRRVRRLLQAKRKLIALLDEQKQAMIHRAVTRGLDPDVPLKDSGVEWLGKVPVVWEVFRGRFLFEIKKRIVGELGHPVISVTQAGLRIKDIKSFEGQMSLDYSKYQIVKVGEFAMNAMDLLTGGVGIAAISGVTSPDYRVFALRANARCHDIYILYVLRMLYENKGFYAWGQGSAQLGRWRLPRKRFNDFPFPVPPLLEQTAIVRYINRAAAEIDSTAARANREIELLNEYRTRLIADVVTGKLDVRNVASRLPDENDDLEATENADSKAHELDTLPEEEA